MHIHASTCPGEKQRERLYCRGSTSTTTTFHPSRSTLRVLPVGCKKVRGEKRTSASAGKAESHARSAPRSMKLTVLTLSSSEHGESE